MNARNPSFRLVLLENETTIHIAVSLLKRGCGHFSKLLTVALAQNFDRFLKMLVVVLRRLIRHSRDIDEHELARLVAQHHIAWLAIPVLMTRILQMKFP